MPTPRGETRLLRRLALLLAALSPAWQSRAALVAAVGLYPDEPEHAGRMLRGDIDALRELGFQVERAPQWEPEYRLTGHERFGTQVRVRFCSRCDEWVPLDAWDAGMMSCQTCAASLPAPDELTYTEFGALIGVSRQRVHQLLAQGRLRRPLTREQAEHYQRGSEPREPRDRILAAMTDTWRTAEQIAQRAGHPLKPTRVLLVVLHKQGLIEQTSGPASPANGHPTCLWRRIR